MLKTYKSEYLIFTDFIKHLDSIEKGLGQKFWDHAIETRHGNQKFTNDTFYIYNIECIDPKMEGVYEIKELSRAEADTIYKELKHVSCIETKDTSILFSVSW